MQNPGHCPQMLQVILSFHHSYQNSTSKLKSLLFCQDRTSVFPSKCARRSSTHTILHLLHYLLHILIDDKNINSQSSVKAENTSSCDTSRHYQTSNLQEVALKLERHILSNGPHPAANQQALEVFQSYILGAISCYFASKLIEDPVYGTFILVRV